MQIKMQEDAARFSINLHSGRAIPEADIGLHFNPRLDQNKVNLRNFMDFAIFKYQSFLIFS